jgi:hypothetical protein
VGQGEAFSPGLRDGIAQADPCGWGTAACRSWPHETLKRLLLEWLDPMQPLVCNQRGLDYSMLCRPAG